MGKNKGGMGKMNYIKGHFERKGKEQRSIYVFIYFCPNG